MTNEQFVAKLLDVLNYKTKYAKGTFGQNATDSFINQKAKQYPEWYSESRIANLKALPDDTKLFDCVGLIKGVMWGFPNIIYTSNGVKDYSDQSIYDASYDKSSNFANLQVGELLWIQGHVGVAIGDYKAIECTNAWKGTVQITGIGNFNRSFEGLNVRKWTKHAKLPFITYVQPTQNAPQGSTTNETPKSSSNTYPVLKKGSKGDSVKTLQTLLKNNGCDPKGIDGDFGNNTLAALKKFQEKKFVTGVADERTWKELYK